MYLNQRAFLKNVSINLVFHKTPSTPMPQASMDNSILLKSAQYIEFIIFLLVM